MIFIIQNSRYEEFFIRSMILHHLSKSRKGRLDYFARTVHFIRYIIECNHNFVEKKKIE